MNAMAKKLLLFLWISHICSNIETRKLFRLAVGPEPDLRRGLEGFFYFAS
jgi:hypothetical protein